MVTSIVDAANNLSELVRLAANGEEVVITLGGQPAARITGIKETLGSTSPPGASREAWAAEMQETADSVVVGSPRATPQAFWDALRGERA